MTWKNWASRKIEPNIPKNISREADVRRREGAVAEEAQRQHRLRRAQLPEHEQRQHDGTAGDRRSMISGLAPADLVAPHETPDDPEQADAGEADPRQVERVVRAAALAQAQRGERDQYEPDRHVQPEDPLPRDALDDRAADERADRHGEAADPTPGPEHEAAPLLRALPALRIVSVSGVTIAPPRPCSARAAISTSI